MQPLTPAPRARILSNLYLPDVEGYAVRCIGHYSPPGLPQSQWLAEMERRDLSAILPLIPAAEQPDILVCASPEYLPIPWDIHTFKGPKVLLITDWNVCLRFLPDLCKLFDHCFTDWPGYRLLRKAGVANVHHQALFGHDPARFRPTGTAGSPRNLDVSFCGNLNSGLHGERNRLVARVARWAHRTGRPVHLRQAFDDAYIDVLNRSRLVFNYSIRGEANMRLFEAMACGAVPLVEETNQEVGILFQEGRHYFRYALGGLEAKLDELLGQPERVAAVAAEAQREVGRHTKARQYEAMLDTVLREEGKAGGARGPVVPSVDTRKALAKIRVLGMGYTAQEAMQEIQARVAECPGLDIEALPGLLFALMSKEGDPAAGPARRALEHLLGQPGMPGFLRVFLRLQAALQAREWPGALALAEECRQAVEAADSASLGTAGPLYRFLLPPVGLGNGMNSDINKACEEDLRGGGAATGSSGGGRGLLLEHSRSAGARARLALGSAREALAEWGEAGPRSYASLPRFPLLVAAALGAGETGTVREACRVWFGEAPLDTGAWENILAALERIEDRGGRLEFLRDIHGLSRFFLDPAQCDRIAALIGAS